MMRLLLFILMLLMALPDVSAQGGSGVYVGGHIRRERPNTVTKLKNSGFTYVILFDVTVEEDGTLTTDGETICQDGEYVFANKQPYYVEDVKALKTWPTGIERIEICIGGWGNQSYSRIRDLINRDGISQNTILYRNFKALKDAIPEIDAVNNDDEHCYDVSTAVKFHVMMRSLGYKTSVAPYMNKSFWESLVTQVNQSRPGTCDLVMIQCYDGGAYNNPSDWHLGGLPLHAGRTNYQTDMNTSVAQMETWRDNCDVTGGFVWVYNDETWNLNQWASAMNRVFPSKEVDSPVVTFYSENSFRGYAIELPEGTFCTGELSVYGITDKDISSFKMLPGYQLTGYANADLTGSSNTWTDVEVERMGAWGNRISSLKIEKVEIPTSIQTTGIDSESVDCYNLQGMKVVNEASGNSHIRVTKGRKVVVR